MYEKDALDRLHFTYSPKFDENALRSQFEEKWTLQEIFSGLPRNGTSYQALAATIGKIIHTPKLYHGVHVRIEGHVEARQHFYIEGLLRSVKASEQSQALKLKGCEDRLGQAGVDGSYVVTGNSSLRCDEGTLLCNRYTFFRAYCPVTCGCSSPFSGLRWGAWSDGCPSECLANRMKIQGNASWTCTNMGLEALLVHPGWQRLLAEVDWKERNEQIFLVELGPNITARLRQEGCPANITARVPASWIRPCNMGMASFCPEACACAEIEWRYLGERTKHCPKSCKRRGDSKWPR